MKQGVLGDGEKSSWWEGEQQEMGQVRGHKLCLDFTLLSPDGGAAEGRCLELGWQAKEVEETIEGMLLRLEEFCSLADLIRSDTSQILEENIPVLKAKLTEMRGIYAKVDRLEAFVKMVGHHVAFLEADVLQAERDHGAFPQALRRWLGSAGLPSFRNKLPAPVPVTYELPTLYRTEDYFPVDAGEAQHHPRTCPRPL
ncbi:breast carcinoma-amplified sequence 4 isoform X3 [Symphalangus syndactylus]|uniref:breast carcinoma-amplified sequence 4 isoform X3 n=1 Tax=Symphalangus syndactylus TaxID=9590 RepID=UPI0030067AC0